MLKKLFAIFGAASATHIKAQPAPSAAESALLRQIAERSKTDPLIGAKIGSKEITQVLIGTMKTERGVHIESLLCALGALAGYSCQAAIRMQAVARGISENALFAVMETKDGKTYFFGDHLNKPLVESQYSVWGIAGSGAQQAGCENLPDILEIFKHTSMVVGSHEFGVPRVPDQHKPHDLPLNYVRTLWPALAPLIVKFCPNPEHWPILLGFSVQEVIIMGKSVLDPCIAFRLVMESAVPMSKVNLDAL